MREKGKKTEKPVRRLYTEEGLNLPEVPWNVYPRPQMRRDKWLCLNGEWSFSIDGKGSESIMVPFCPESLLSGIRNPPVPGAEMTYEREFEIPPDWENLRVLLHFGAVSRICTVSVNGIPVIRNEQAYLPFQADITEYLCPGTNLLSLRVINDLSAKYPWGKQCMKRGGMWYTPVSGIWQTVWLEPVPPRHIESLNVETGTDYAEIHVIGAEQGIILFEEKQIPIEKGSGRITIEDQVLWSPENPYLYHFEVICGEDRISSYFVLRTLETKTINGVSRLCLNGEPYFFNGLLDQGYWSDGLYTPASPEAFEKDILAMKSLGFNTLRKHIKIEPEQFYYDCDRLGMVVFQDMVNNGRYRYLRDTVLPTVGFLCRHDDKLNYDPDARKIFLESMDATVLLLKNHPCICLWTIFNEGWGQFCADDAYRRLKALDTTRFVDSTSGWFHQELNDVDSLHIYFKKLHLGKEEKPQLLSEFGGYSYKIPQHSFNLEKTYGYRKFEDRESFVKALQALYMEVNRLKEQGLSGAIYTQLSDVEDETNGLFTYDRRILKLRPGELDL